MKKRFLVPFLAVILVTLFMVSCVQTKQEPSVYGPPILVSSLPVDNAIVSLDNDVYINWEFRAGDLVSGSGGEQPTVTTSSLYFTEQGGLWVKVADAGATGNHKVLDLEYGKTYNWRVTAEDSNGKVTSSKNFSFTVENDPTGVYGNPTVSLTSPVDLSAHDNTTVTLVWDAQGGALLSGEGAVNTPILETIVSYRVFGATEWTEIELEDEKTTDLSELLRGTVYQWKVSVVQQYNGLTAEAGPRQFRVKGYGAPTVTMISPANNAINKPQVVTLKWLGTPGLLQTDDRGSTIDGYDVYLDGERVVENTPLTQYTTEELAYSSVHEWYVVAHQGETSSVPETWSFTVKDDPTPEYGNPTVNLETPSVDAVKNDPLVSFTWNAQGGQLVSGIGDEFTAITETVFSYRRVGATEWITEALVDEMEYSSDVFERGSSYEWKVLVKQGDDKTATAGPREFRIKDYGVPGVDLQQPLNDAENLEPEVTLSWQGIAGVLESANRAAEIDHYVVYINGASETTTEQSITKTFGLGEIVTWYVEAYQGTDVGVSSEWTFAIRDAHTPLIEALYMDNYEYNENEQVADGDELINVNYRELIFTVKVTNEDTAKVWIVYEGSSPLIDDREIELTYNEMKNKFESDPITFWQLENMNRQPFSVRTESTEAAGQRDTGDQLDFFLSFRAMPKVTDIFVSQGSAVKLLYEIEPDDKIELVEQDAGTFDATECLSVSVYATAMDLSRDLSTATMSLLIYVDGELEYDSGCVNQSMPLEGCCVGQANYVNGEISLCLLPKACDESTYKIDVVPYHCEDVDGDGLPNDATNGPTVTFNIVAEHNQPELLEATVTAYSQCATSRDIRVVVDPITNHMDIEFGVTEDEKVATITGIIADGLFSKCATGALRISYTYDGTTHSTVVTHDQETCSSQPSGQRAAGSSTQPVGVNKEKILNREWVHGVALPVIPVGVATGETLTITIEATDVFCPGETWTVDFTPTPPNCPADKDLDLTLDPMEFFYFDGGYCGDPATMTVWATCVEQIEIKNYQVNADGFDIGHKQTVIPDYNMPICNHEEWVFSTASTYEPDFDITRSPVYLFPDVDGVSPATVTPGETKYFELWAYETRPEFRGEEDSVNYTLKGVLADATLTLSQINACEFNDSPTDTLYTNFNSDIDADAIVDFWPAEWLEDFKTVITVVSSPTSNWEGVDEEALNSKTAKAEDFDVNNTVEGTYVFKATLFGTPVCSDVMIEIASDYATLVYDTTYPDASIEATDNGSTQVDVTFIATDTLAKLGSMAVTFESTQNCPDCDPGVPLLLNTVENPAPLKGEEVATLTVTYDASRVDGATLTFTGVAKDRACNATEVTTEIWVDNVAPRLALSVDPITGVGTLTTDATQATITVVATDCGLLDEVDVTITSGATLAVLDPLGVSEIDACATTLTVTITATDAADVEGTVTVLVTATDTTGNVSTETIDIRVDNKAPVIDGFGAYSVTGGNDYVRVSFDEPVQFNTITGRLEAEGGVNELFTSASLTVDNIFNNSYRLTLETDSLGIGDIATITIDAGLKDTVGNEASAEQVATNTISETT